MAQKQDDDPRLRFLKKKHASVRMGSSDLFRNEMKRSWRARGSSLDMERALAESKTTEINSRKSNEEMMARVADALLVYDKELVEVERLGNCFFMAVNPQLKQLGLFDGNHSDLRAHIVGWLRSTPGSFDVFGMAMPEDYDCTVNGWNKFISDLSTNYFWAEEVTVLATGN
jgi:hypothetical protein